MGVEHVSLDDIYARLEKNLLEDLVTSITKPHAEFQTEPYGDGCCIVNYDGTAQRIIVPQSIDGRTVLSIQEKAFSDLKKVDQVILPEGLMNIDKKAFYGSDIAEVVLPSTLKTIGESAFSFSNIVQLCIPESVSVIPSQLCYVCPKLKVVIILGATTIDTYAFRDCDKLEKVALPKTLLEIGYGAFSFCKKLKYIIIPQSVVKIHAQCGYINERTDSVSLSLAILNDNVEWVINRSSDFTVNLFSNRGSTTNLIAKNAIGDHGDLEEFSKALRKQKKKNA